MTLWIILIAYLVVMIGIGIYCNKLNSSVSDFVLGGRTLGPWMTAFAYGTSYFSAVIFVGYAGKFGWSYGVASTWIGIGNALIGSLLAWIVLGKRTRVMTKHLDAKTMPEFFEKRYSSKGLKIASAIIIFLFLIPYTASVFNGLSRLFGMAFNFKYEYCIIAMGILTAAYVILGGYKATAMNDFIQGIFMLVGIAAVVITTLSEQGGFFTALNKLSIIPAANGETNQFNSLFGPDPINLVGVIILTSLGTWGLPQMVQKFYAIKDNKSIKIGTIVSTVFAVVVAGGSYFLGGFGRLFSTATKEGAPVVGFDGVVPEIISKLPSLLIGVVIVLVLSASMSTLSSLVLTSSSTLTIDLIKPLSKNITEKKQVLLLRIFIAVFILLSVVIAIFTLHNETTVISTLMSISWGALAGAFLAPFMYGLFSKKITKAAVWASFISGVGITVVHMFIFTFGHKTGTLFGINLASPINAGAFAMLFSLILVPVVSLISPKMKKETVDNVFSCLHEKVEDKKFDEELLEVSKTRD